ncbi:hypothetical protein QVD17_39663 [Tagetes erecta]|uniref:Uncharacterized protein n=1 Tax=Tagetes erecta TaxID=13708 RepID=A0AAD8NHB4_TARER|nr:hypothetical protein QVD17_39663 [Tagetes erecta]
MSSLGDPHQKSNLPDFNEEPTFEDLNRATLRALVGDNNVSQIAIGLGYEQALSQLPTEGIAPCKANHATAARNRLSLCRRLLLNGIIGRLIPRSSKKTDSSYSFSFRIGSSLALLSLMI